MATPIGNGKRIAQIKAQIAAIAASGEVRYGSLSYYLKNGERYPKFVPNRRDARTTSHSCSKQRGQEYRVAIARGRQIIQLEKELKRLTGGES